MAIRFSRWRLVLLLGLVAWLASSWWLSGELLTPQRRLPGPPPSVPGMDSEMLALRTIDGIHVAAWAVSPTRPPRAACLLLHALEGCRSPERAAFAASRGLAVLALDLRGHGESGGEATGFGWHERAEVSAAVAEIQRRWPGLPVLGWGTSLGAAALVYAVDPAAPDALPPDTFAALVLESLYADINTAFRNRADLLLGAWGAPLLWPARRLTSWRAGLIEDRLSPEAALARLAEVSEVELLLATGSHDRLSTPEELDRLAKASGGRAVLVQGGLHADLIGKDDGAWLSELTAFLDRHGGGR